MAPLVNKKSETDTAKILYRFPLPLPNNNGKSQNQHSQPISETVMDPPSSIVDERCLHYSVVLKSILEIPWTRRNFRFISNKNAIAMQSENQFPFAAGVKTPKVPHTRKDEELIKFAACANTKEVYYDLARY